MSKDPSNIPCDSCEDKNENLPPYPMAFFPLSDWDKEYLTYKDDPTKMNRRMAHKLFKLWVLWAGLINNEKLRDIVQIDDDKHDSDIYFLKSNIVNTMDQMAKILSNTDITEELVSTNK